MTLRLVVTIDTEPDNQWTMPAPGLPAPPLAFANTRALPRVIDFLHDLGVPGTWLTSYSVARDPDSARVLRSAAAGGDEIGGHLHAWETPPLTPADGQAHPYIYEYDPTVRLQKLRALTDALRDVFGASPASYRAGRWGIDAAERENLASLGYTIDTSVVPGHDFGPSRGLTRGGPDFRAELSGTPPRPRRVSGIWEAPVSVATLGLLGAAGSWGGGALGARMAAAVSSRQDLPSRACRRLLSSAGLSRMVWLRPLMHPREDLVSAARDLARRGAGFVNIMFHSSETMAGTSPRSRTHQDVERFFEDMRAMVGALRAETAVEGCTLRRAIETMDGS